MSQPLLEVNRLKNHFPIKGGFFQRTVGRVHAVDGVSFRLEKGETMGLVGECGCGKSTTGRLILRLIKPTSGEIRFNGQDIGRLDRRRMKAVRRDMQLIFQDPYASLNPRLTVGGIVGEAFKIHGVASGTELEDRTTELLKRVGLHTEKLDNEHKLYGQLVDVKTQLGQSKERLATLYLSRAATGTNGRNQLIVDTMNVANMRLASLAGKHDENMKLLAYQLDERNKLLIGLYGFVERREDVGPRFEELTRLVTSLGDSGGGWVTP